MATAPGWSNLHALHALDVGDEYEDLSEKVLSAFQWVGETYDRLEGVFKTDDDIVFAASILNYSELHPAPGMDSVLGTAKRTHLPPAGP